MDSRTEGALVRYVVCQSGIYLFANIASRQSVYSLLAALEMCTIYLFNWSPNPHLSIKCSLQIDVERLLAQIGGSLH